VGDTGFETESRAIGNRARTRKDGTWLGDLVWKRPEMRYDGNIDNLARIRHTADVAPRGMIMTQTYEDIERLMETAWADACADFGDQVSDDMMVDLASSVLLGEPMDLVTEWCRRNLGFTPASRRQRLVGRWRRHHLVSRLRPRPDP